MNSDRPTRLPRDRVFTFSQSSLQDYVDCPRRFQLKYVEALSWPAVQAEPVAQLESRQRDALLFHLLVHQYFLGIAPDRLEAMAASRELSRWWRNFVAAAPDLAGWRLYMEKALVLPIGSHRLVSKFDLLAVRDGKALIYDWKTFAKRPKNEWLAARLQTKVYRAVLARAGHELNGGRQFLPQDISMVYWFADFPRDPAAFDYDETEHLRDWHMLEGLVREISNGVAFPLTNDADMCRFCNYRSLCERGQGAGIDADPDLDSTELESSESELEQIGQIQI